MVAMSEICTTVDHAMESTNVTTPRRVRDMRSDDAQLVVGYFRGLSPDDHNRMGIDPAMMPDDATWIARLQEDLSRPVAERRGHFVVWEVDGAPVGHSNIGNLERPSHGHMHLHMWRSGLRAHGHGRVLVLESVKRYLELFGLQVVYCQPNAFNVAPNRALSRAGFEYLETYETMPPGTLNYYQPVTRWAMTRERLAELQR